MVQKKIATSIGVYYDVDNLDLGRLVIYAVPAPGVAVEKIELSIEEALSSLIKGNWPDLAERFQEAKSKLITEQVYNRDSLYYPARVFGTALATNQRVSDVEKWSERLDSVSLQNVLDAAKFIFDQIYITGTLIPERDKI